MKDSAFEDFSEGVMDAVYDFARCQRPDGSYYGTSGQCRKGSPVGAKEKSSNTKQLRKDMISARDNEKKLRAERKAAEAGDDKKAAAAARRAHIDSKKEAKEAASRFQSGQKEAGDVRRFGRSDERDKASIKELKDAAASGKLSPTKQAAVERDIRTRTAREKSPTATAKASKDPAVQKRLLQTEIKKVSAKYERLRGKPEAAAERKKLMDRASEIVKKLGEIDAAASKAAGPKKPDTSLPAQQRRSSAAARARD